MSVISLEHRRIGVSSTDGGFVFLGDAYQYNALDCNGPVGWGVTHTMLNRPCTNSRSNALYTPRFLKLGDGVFEAVDTLLQLVLCQLMA